MGVQLGAGDSKTNKIKSSQEKGWKWGTWVAQSVEGPTSAQAMISQVMGSDPELGSALTVGNLLGILSLLLPHLRSFSLKINT